MELKGDSKISIAKQVLILTRKGYGFYTSNNGRKSLTLTSEISQRLFKNKSVYIERNGSRELLTYIIDQNIK